MSTDTSAVANLSPQQMKDTAQKALQQKEDQHNALFRSGGLTKFIQTAQNSLLFQPDCRWDDMLSGAPLSIAVMGSIFVASTASGTSAVIILPPKEGFKYIPTFLGASGEMPLQDALVQIASKGSQAFMLASRNMQAIASYSDAIIGKITDFNQLLGDPQSAQMMLKPTVDALKKPAQTAAKLAKEVADAYHDWLGATCEVHAACCQTSTNDAEKLRANEVHLAVEQAQLQQGQQAVDAAKENLDTLKASLQHAEEQYKKAANEFPSGWGLIGMEIVSNLAATANSALNQAIPVLVSKLSITTQGSEVANIFKGDKGGIKGEQAADHSKVPDATSKNTPPLNAPVLPEDYTDIAYNLIRSSYGHIQTVASLLSGQDGKVDWDSITSTDSEKVKSGLSVTKILLDGDFKALGVKPDEKQPTKNLKKVIQTCLTVIGEVNQYTGSNLAGKSKPADDSDEVKKWRKDISQAYIDATALYQTSRTIPGADTPATPPPAGGTPAVPDGSGFRAQIIDAATAKINSTSAVLQTTQTNLQASSKDYLKAMNDFGLLQGQLATLKADKVQLNEIRALLLKCIELLVQFQNQINKLVAFFDAIDYIVTIVVETQVAPFVDQISAATSAPLTLGGYTMTEFTSILLFNSMLNIRCYFTLFNDLARLYVDIHQKYLVKGLALQGELSSQDRGPEAAKRLPAIQAQLNAYTNDTLPSIKDDITKRQQNAIVSMKDNADAAAKDVQILPTNPPTLQQQIEGASKQSVETAQKGIEASGSYARKPLLSSSE